MNKDRDNASHKRDEFDSSDARQQNQSANKASHSSDKDYDGQRDQAGNQSRSQGSDGDE